MRHFERRKRYFRRYDKSKYLLGNFVSTILEKIKGNSVVHKNDALHCSTSLISNPFPSLTFFLFFLQMHLSAKSVDDDLELPWDETYWGSCCSSAACCNRMSDNVSLPASNHSSFSLCSHKTLLRKIFQGNFIKFINFNLFHQMQYSFRDKNILLLKIC